MAIHVRARSLSTPRQRRADDAWLPVDARGIPVGRQPVDDTSYDFRRPRPIAAIRGDNGLARVRLAAKGGAAEVALWLDASHPYLMVFTGASLPEHERLRR